MLAANAVLSLINIGCYLLDRQIEKLGDTFEKEGGFSERLYKIRSSARKRH
jgi:four helix bundle suffix protein